MSDSFAASFITWIATMLGIRVRESDRLLLWQRILSRVKALGLASPEAYYYFLTTQPKTARWDNEWRELVSLLTVTESYFFRDRGQFHLLKHHILPDVIQRKQALSRVNSSRSTVRIWSAGCSTGEEAYSLAIVLQELLPDPALWNIVVLGTDVNAVAVERARRGFYNDWSFRTVDPAIKQKYFRQHRDEWEIDPQIRKMVRFQVSNLVQDRYPDPMLEISDLDLIVCRNVFIYFESEAIALVLNQFHRSLSQGGYLLTGHTELYGQEMSQFQVVSFPESIVYQRSLIPKSEGNSIATNISASLSESDVLATSIPTLLQQTSSYSSLAHLSKTPPSTKVTCAQVGLDAKVNHVTDLNLSSSTNISTTNANTNTNISTNISATGAYPTNKQELNQDITALMNRKAYAEAIDKLKEVIASDPRSFQAYCSMAEAYANSGNYLSATQVCQQAIQVNPLATEPYYLLAQISEEQGDIEGAKIFLKRIVYLAPDSIAAYLDLGSLYEQEGNLQKAKRVWQSALNLLSPMAQNVIVDHYSNLRYSNLTAAELSAYVERNLQKC